jgi:hypothetical protein
MSEVQTFHGRVSGVDVTAMLCESVDDIYALRAADSWHEGAVALLRFPTADPQAYVSLDNPKYFGRAVGLGSAVVKGPAGDFGVVPIPGFLETYEEVAA